MIEIKDWSKSESYSNFTFEISDTHLPKVCIGGISVSLVDCIYHYSTCTSDKPSIQTAFVSGYFDGETNLRIFGIYFTTGRAIELYGVNAKEAYKICQLILETEAKNNG